MIAGGLEHAHVAARKVRLSLALSDHVLQPGVDPTFERAGIIAPPHALPVGGGPVHPAAVVGLGRIVTIAVVIERADLIAEVNQGNAPHRDNDTVDQQDAANGKFHFLFAFFA